MPRGVRRATRSIALAELYETIAEIARVMRMTDANNQLLTPAGMRGDARAIRDLADAAATLANLAPEPDEAPDA